MRTVLCAEGAAEPSQALNHYLRLHPPTAADPVRLVFGIRRTPVPLRVPLPEGLDLASFVPGRGLRDLPVQVVRWRYSEICRRLSSGEFRPDVVLACTTPPDARGARSLGVVDGYLGAALEVAARTVVEEVGWLPRIPGAPVVRADEVVPSDLGAGGDHFAAPFDDVDLAIARALVKLLPDEPTLALGIGRVPDAAAWLLRERRGLKLLTGVVTPAVRDLVDAGAITGSVQTMSVVGPPELLEWAAASGRVRILPSTIVHNPDHLGSVDRFVAVLGALEVDLHGNVNAERVRQRDVSGMGGAPDFAEGAHRSPGGMTIVALRSTDSRNRSRLSQQVGTITVRGEHVDAIVTEKGAAWLAGCGSADRAELIRAVFA